MLVEPAHMWVPEYHQTFGPEVGELASLAGYAPDPEQQLILDAIFAVDRAGRPVAFETAMVACRQNLKTAAIKQAVLGWLFVTGERLIVFSAHEFSTAQEAFKDFDQLIGGSDFLRKKVKHMYRTNGAESFELFSGSRLIFRTRTRGGGRGLSGDKVVLDEAFALQPMHMGALMPTLSARPDPQLVYGSSAGLVDSTVLRGVRDRGRAGGEPTLAYFEWCAPPPVEACRMGAACSHAVGAPGCGCDDPELWQRANPAMGRRISREYIAAERRAMPAEEFGRERMGWWDDPLSGASPFPAGVWSSLVDVSAPRPECPSLVVDVSPGQVAAAIGVAGRVGDVMHVDVLEHRPGMAWVPDRMAELAAEVGPCEVALLPGSEAGALLPDLEERGFKAEPGDGEWRLRLVSKRTYAQACGAFLGYVVASTLRHRDRPELNAAVDGVRAKPMDDAFTWSRPGSDVDIAPLVAVTVAAWVFATHVPVEEPKHAPPWVMHA